ncbi:GGDEF domain-containing protein [Rhizobium rhizophilum]|uniref:GGDEF domain-containing protein n=1 Tax=Rhizobium rhizophilum TaxID=1850373 RepID=UPI001F16B3D9|nr:GGDEF domain-containing protein [Rhizobium rhizophilum]
MILVRNWLWQSIDPGSFEAPGAISSFALAVSFRSVIVTSLAAFASLPLLYGLHILALPLAQMAKLIVAFSWLFAGTLSGTLAYVAGNVIRDLDCSRAEFQRLSQTDSLTGLANRRAFNDTLATVHGEASLAIIDIDRFKRINDRFGHQAGDEVIRTIAVVLGRVFGNTLLVSRLGGEEFGVILKGGTVEQRLAMLEQARQAVASDVNVFDDNKLAVTVSIGVAEFMPGRRVEGVYAAADRALYLAKDCGRDRLVHERNLPFVEAPAHEAGGLVRNSRVSMPRG